MESLEMSQTEHIAFDKIFKGIYRGKKVLVTGHTGFKGSWLTFWLQLMGADVLGYALAPNSDPSHFSLLNLKTDSRLADIRNFQEVNECFQFFQPEIVFHLAAQSLVRKSYRNPLYTFETNIMGTANVIESARLCESVRAVVGGYK